MRIARWTDEPARAELESAIDAIFFEASAVKAFESREARAAYRDRWLGCYQRLWPENVWLALEDREPPLPPGVLGYLVGCTENPATSPHFSDLAYFQAFAALCADYPAHLHINVAAAHRGAGIGAHLVAAFIADLRRRGVPGVHVVTGAKARNIGFYAQQGFQMRGQVSWRGNPVVLLGRILTD